MAQQDHNVRLLFSFQEPALLHRHLQITLKIETRNVELRGLGGLQGRKANHPHRQGTHFEGFAPICIRQISKFISRPVV